MNLAARLLQAAAAGPAPDRRPDLRAGRPRPPSATASSRSPSRARPGRSTVWAVQRHPGAARTPAAGAGAGRAAGRPGAGDPHASGRWSGGPWPAAARCSASSARPASASRGWPPRLSTSAERLGFAVYGGACRSYGTTTGYLVWRLDLARPARARRRRCRSPSSGPNSWPRLVAARAGWRGQRAPLLAPVLDLPMPDSELTASLDPQARAELLRSLLLDLPARQAAAGPLLLVLEDCHWIDPASMALLEFLARNLADLPVLPGGGARGAATGPSPARVAGPPCPRHRAAARRPASRGRRAAGRRAAAAPLRRARRAVREVVRRVAERAGGNPFYVEELVGFLHARGVDPQRPATARRPRAPRQPPPPGAGPPGPAQRGRAGDRQGRQRDRAGVPRQLALGQLPGGRQPGGGGRGTSSISTRSASPRCARPCPSPSTGSSTPSSRRSPTTASPSACARRSTSRSAGSSSGLRRTASTSTSTCSPTTTGGPGTRTSSGSGSGRPATRPRPATPTRPRSSTTSACSRCCHEPSRRGAARAGGGLAPGRPLGRCRAGLPAGDRGRRAGPATGRCWPRAGATWASCSCAPGPTPRRSAGSTRPPRSLEQLGDLRGLARTARPARLRRHPAGRVHGGAAGSRAASCHRHQGRRQGTDERRPAQPRSRPLGHRRVRHSDRVPGTGPGHGHRGRRPPWRRPRRRRPRRPARRARRPHPRGRTSPAGAQGGG